MLGTGGRPATIPEATYEPPYGNTLVGAYAMAAHTGTCTSMAPPVFVLGSSESHTHAHISQMPDLTITAAAVTAPRAFAGAGVTPDEIDMAMIYDSFTITVLLLLEDLGFCKKGEGGAFVQGGRIALGGQLPINTDGSGLSSNHPGMRGIFPIIEATRQLRSQCGARQVEGAKLAVAHGSGGLLSSQATTILGR